MNDLRKEEHFRRLAETSRRVWSLLDSAIQDHIRTHGLHNLIPDFEVMLRRKRQGVFLRPYVARLFLELVGEREWHSPENLCALAAIEAYNISTYHANIAIDHKFGPDEHQSPANQFMCAMQMLGVAHDLICRGATDNIQFSRATRFLMTTNDIAYSALNIDVNTLSDKGLELLPSGPVSFEALYLKRCKGICGSTFQLAILPLMKLDGDSCVVQALASIASHLGVGVQIVNDLEDLAPCASRRGQPHKDLANGRMTLPYYLLDRRGYGRELLLEMSAVSKGNSSATALSSLAFESGVVDEVKRFIRVNAWNPIRSQLRYLSRRQRVQSLRYFQFAHHLLFGSRIWKAFEMNSPSCGA